MTALTPSSPTTPLGRRALLRGAAWTVPAVTMAAAAPAYATSDQAGTPPNSGVTPGPTCRPVYYRLDWARDWTRPAGGTGTRSVLVTPGNTELDEWDPVNLTVSSTFFGNMQALDIDAARNLAVTQAAVGGTGSRGLTLAQRLSSNDARTTQASHTDRQVVSFTFDRDVTQLSFTITDIDGHEHEAARTILWWTTPGVGQYHDRVHLSLPAEGRLGNRVSGQGSDSAPWVSSIAPNTGSEGQDNASTLATSSSRGNVAVTFSEPVRSFSLAFSNAETRQVNANGQQAIFLSNFSFTASSCM